MQRELEEPVSRVSERKYPKLTGNHTVRVRAEGLFTWQSVAGRMTRKSRYPYSETVASLSKAIVEAGNTIFATIDQAEAAASAGLTLRPTTLLLFGNPKGGTPLMDAFPLVALDLPLKVLVWEQDGAVRVAYTPMSEVVARYDVTGMDERIAAMDRALDSLTSAIA